MPEIALTQTPAHVRHGSNIGQPLTRRDGVLKVTGAARYAADNHPPGMLYAVLAVSSIARGRVAFLDVAAAKAPSRRRRGDDAGQPAAARAGSGRQDQSLHVPARPAAERPGPLRQPADRGGDRRDAGGRDRRRRAAVAALRERAGARSVSMRPRASCRRRVGVGNPAEVHRGDVEAGLAAASKRIDGDLRDAGAVSQRHGAARDRGGVGRRHALDRHAEPGPGHGAGAHRRTVRHLAGQDPHPQSVPRRRLRLQGLHLRAAGPRHHGGAAGRQAGQAGAAPRADVRPGRPSRADAADAAHGRRRRRQADRARSSHQDRVEHLRRLLRAGVRRLAYALCQPGHRHVA